MASIARPLLRATQPARIAFRASTRITTPRPAVAGPSRLLPLIQQQRWKSTQTDSASQDASSADTTAPENPAIEAPRLGQKSQPIGKLEPRLSMTFTCTANDCGHRSTHEFSKRSYTKGIVLVQCPSCKNRHLIADHLGWFKESTEAGTLKTVEDLLRAKGETIKKGRVNMDGDIEYDPEAE